MKYDLSIASEQVVNDLNKKTKHWLIKHARWLNLQLKQAVTDHAMEVSRLNAVIQTERKTNEHWRTEANKFSAGNTAVCQKLAKEQAKVEELRAIIHSLGCTVEELGNVIARGAKTK